MPLFFVLVLCVAACFRENMTENLSSLIVAHSVEASLGSDILREYHRVDYQGTVGTVYVGSQAVYFTGVASYLFLEKKTELLTWQSVRQLQKVNDHSIEFIVANDATLREMSHVFTITDHSYDRDKIWAFLMSVYNDALVDHTTASLTTESTTPTKRGSARNGSLLKRTNSDPLMQSSGMVKKTSQPASTSQDAETAVTTCDDTSTEQPAPLAKRPSMSKAAASYLDQQLLAQAGAATLDVQAVEALAGKLALQPIPCQYNTVDGKLYAGDAAIYFAGRKFFLWTKQEVLIPWETVTKIQLIEGKSQANESVPVGVQVVAKDDSESSPTEAIHSFLDVDNAAQVVTSLQALQNDNLKSRRRQSRSVRRMNSDPLVTSHADREDHMSGGRAAVEANGQAGVKSQEMIRSPLPKGPGAAANEQDDWTLVLQDNRFPTKVVTNHELECDLDRFYNVFFHDDAKHSIATFLEGRGDSSLKATPWIKEGVNDTRTISYIHPVNAPMAPPQAAARKEQSLRRFDSQGLVVETKTIVQDVPMTDCFYVTDRVRAEAQGDKVALTIEFDIVFVKSTMFKGIISRTTNSECTALFQALARYMSEALGETPVTVEEKIVSEAATEPEIANVWQSLVNQPLLLLFLAIVLIQLFIWNDVRQTRASVTVLEASIEQLLRLQHQNAAYCVANGITPSG